MNFQKKWGPQIGDNDIRRKVCRPSMAQCTKKETSFAPKVVTKLRLKNKRTNKNSPSEQTAFHGKRVGVQQTGGRQAAMAQAACAGNYFTSCGYAQSDGGRTES